MVSMRDKLEIVLQYFREGKSKRRISRDLGLHRSTVSRYIKEHQDEQSCVDTGCSKIKFSSPSYKSSNRVSRALTIDVCSRIDALLELNQERRLYFRSVYRLRCKSYRDMPLSIR